MSEPLDQDRPSTSGTYSDDGSFAAAKTRDAALILPVIGLFMLTPPLVTVFGAEINIFGVPLIVLYLFCIWAALILCAAGLSRRLIAKSTTSKSAHDQIPQEPAE